MLYEIAKNLPRKWKRRILLGVDLFLVPVSLTLALFLYNSTVWSTGGLGFLWPNYLLLTVLAGMLSVTLGIPGIKLNAYETRAILRTGILAALLTIAGAGLNGLAYEGLPLTIFINFGFLFFGLSVASRLIGLRILLWIYLAEGDRTRVLVYGAGATGVQLVVALSQSEEIVPVGFVDDNPTLQGMMVAGLQVYPATRIADLATSLKIDRVVLAMPSLSLPRQDQIARRLEGLGCDVHRLPSFSELIGNNGLVGNLEPVRPPEYLGRPAHETDIPGVGASYAGMVVLVSGAGGSIGAELCRQLVGYQPKMLVLFEQSEPALYAIDLELRALAETAGIAVQSVLGSVCDRALVGRTMAANKVDIVLHAAAHKHVPLLETNEIEGLRNNILGTRVLADAAQQNGANRFVLISSDKAVRPTNIMGASKRLAELVIQDLANRSQNTLFSMVRFGNVLGSSGSVIPLFQAQIVKGGPVTVTHTDITRYFMTLAEAVHLVLLAGGVARGGDVLVLDMGKPVSIQSLARQMIVRAGYSVRDKTNPDGDIEIRIVGLRVGEKMYEELVIGSDMQSTPHPKILRAQEESLSEIEVANMLKDLSDLVECGDGPAARKLVQRWVNGYHSPKSSEMASSRIGNYDTHR